MTHKPTHRHAKVLRWLADGEKVQFRNLGQSHLQDWDDVTLDGTCSNLLKDMLLNKLPHSFEFRIKPCVAQALPQEALLALEPDAHFIFNNPPGECPQAVRDVIEWYASSVRALLAAAPQPPEAACNPNMQPELATKAAPVQLPDPIGVLRVFEPHEGAGFVCTEATVNAGHLPHGWYRLYVSELQAHGK